jgi:TolA-binding protein
MAGSKGAAAAFNEGRLAESSRTERRKTEYQRMFRPTASGRVRRVSVLGVLALGIWALGTAGCAYYNTFYFAKKYFSQAETLALTAGSDKISPEASRKYDEAIKQSTKVLKYHGKSRWVDDALYLIGASFYGKGDYEEALRKFDELVTNYPESRWVPWALYKSGLSYYARKNDDQMDTYFRRVLAEYPKFERNDDILYTTARAAERRHDRVDAVRRYRELVDRYPRSDRGQEGLLRIGDLYYDAGFADSAYTSYAEASRLARDEVGIRNAEVKAADALVRLQRAPEAVRQLERLLPRDETQVRSGETWPAQVRVHLAQAYNATERPLDALATLRQVITKYPQSSYAPEAQFQIGYTYEVYLDSLNAARTAYDQVGRTGTASVFRDQAQTRSRNLAQLQTLSTQAQSDSAAGSEKQAESQLKIAELFLLSQNKVPEAVAKYRQVRTDFPQSRSAPRAAYALAWIRLRRMEGQRDSALAAFSQVIRDYPSSPAARGALDLLVAEQADTAGLGALVVEAAPDTIEAVIASPAPAAPASGISPGGQGALPPGVAPDSLRGTRPPFPDARGARGRSRPGTTPPGTSPADTLGAPRATPLADTLGAPRGTAGLDSLRLPPEVAPSDTLRSPPDGVPPDTSRVPGGNGSPDTLRSSPEVTPADRRKP